MKISFEKIAAGALALALALSMAACKKDGEGSGSSSESSSESTPSESTPSVPEFDYMGKDLTKYVTLGKYKGLQITIPAKAEVTEDDVTEQIKYDLIASKLTNKVTDRAVTKDDTVSISYKGFLDGVQFEGGTGDADPFTVYDGGGFISGFADGLVGVMPGVETDLNLKFPENYHSADLAGKAVVFKVTVKHIYEAKELTDALAAELTGNDKMTVETLRADYLRKMQDRVDTYYENYKISIAFERVSNLATEIEIPKDLVDSYYDAEIAYYQAIADMYETTLSVILSNYGYTEDSLYKSVKKSIFSEMVVYSIIKAENITLSDAEYHEKLQEYIENSDYTEEEILESTPKEKLMEMFTHSKALELIATWQDFIIEEEEKIPEIDFLVEDLTKYLVLGDYKGLTVSVPALPAVTDQEVAESLGNSFMSAKICDKITDRAVTKDDTVSLSYKGFMGGVQFEGGSGDADFFTIYNGGGFIPGFADGIIGATPGTEVSVDLTFPEDYHNKEFAGKAATFKIIVNHIYVPAEITDENAAKLTGDESMTAEKLKAECRKLLEETVAEKHKNDKMALIFKAIIGAAQSVNPPMDMVEYYYSQDVEYYAYYADMKGISYEEMLAEVGFTDETLKERAKDNVMKDIAVYSIAKAENLVVTDENYEEKLAAFAASTGYSKEELEEMYSKKDLLEQLTYNAVYEVIESWQNIVTE